VAQVDKWVGPYTTVPNILAFDKRLSWRAKGIFLYMQAKPPDWDFDSKRMSDESSDGTDATRGGIKELVDLGYLVRKKLPSGKMHYALVEPDCQKPTEGITHRGKSRSIINKDNYKEIKSNTNTGETSSPFVWDEYLATMRKDKRRHIKVIAAFFKVKNIRFNSLEQVRSAIGRHLTAAKELEPFEDERLIETMRRLNYDWPKFTLETVHKELTK
jgi:hypothetical protein